MARKPKTIGNGPKLPVKSWTMEVPLPVKHHPKLEVD
jgi:hypothetical protein